MNGPDLPGWSAAVGAAHIWDPATPEALPVTGCPVCTFERSALTSSPAFAGLPHFVIHPIVVALDAEIRTDLDATLRREEERLWMEPHADYKFDDALNQLRTDAEGALQEAALVRIWTALPALDRLRVQQIEPALHAYLWRHRVPEEVPWPWLF